MIFSYFQRALSRRARACPGRVPGNALAFSGESFSIKYLANNAPAQPAPHADKLRPSAFTVRLAARHSPSLSSLT